MEISSMRKADKALDLKGNTRWGDNLKKRGAIRVLENETSVSDLKYWMKKTPEERLDTVEFLREQFYAIQGYRKIPRIKKVVNKVEMDE
jgi:hypothetical protein